MNLNAKLVLHGKHRLIMFIRFYIIYTSIKEIPSEIYCDKTEYTQTHFQKPYI